MKRLRAVPALLLGAWVGLSAVTALAAGGAWNPVGATQARVPLPNGVTSQDPSYPGALYYQYAPSIVQLSSSQRIIYYCSNREAGVTDDHIAFNVGNLQADGSYAWGATRIALSPKASTTPAWASRHICDPEVVAGEPVLATNQDGTLVLFARESSDMGGQIWFNPQGTTSEDDWGGWRVVEGSGAAMAFEGGPSVGRQADGRLVVAARRWEGSLSVVYLNFQSAPDTASFAPTWTSLHASPAGASVIVEQTQGRLAILARAVDGSIWWRRQDVQNGAFIGWVSLGGTTAAEPPVARLRKDGRLNLVVRAADGRVFQRVQLSPGAPDFTNWALIP